MVEFEKSPFNELKIYLVDENTISEERARVFFTKEYSDSSKDGEISKKGTFKNGRIENYKGSLKRLFEVE